MLWDCLVVVSFVNKPEPMTQAEEVTNKGQEVTHVFVLVNVPQSLLISQHYREMGVC